ncbi:uncharacterized protein LOC114282665 [Camellia sinensis]|uniref:uncharacterized protein LOC114282665 n=1 Tax=Camellia sinensis TaxID=4442 RepID=UPI0010357D88|nr:uncharacterized protein LOC114282665 [Camellia sinensis]
MGALRVLHQFLKIRMRLRCCKIECLVQQQLLVMFMMLLLSRLSMVPCKELMSVMSYVKTLNSCVCSKLVLVTLLWLLECIFRGILFISSPSDEVVIINIFFGRYALALSFQIGNKNAL